MLFRSLFAPFAGIQNYKLTLQQATTQSAIVRTFSFTFLNLLLQFVIGFALALLFNLKFPLRKLARSLVIIPWLLPLLITGFIFQFLLQAEAGAVNTVLENVHLISHPIGFLTSPGWAYVAVLVTTAWLLPWYVAWAVPFAALSADRRLLGAVWALTLSIVVLRLPVFA